MTLLAGTRTGLVELRFGVRGQRTVLLRDTQKAPVMVVRPFELPCGTLMVFYRPPDRGGRRGGDHSEIRVKVEGGARVLVLSQSATQAPGRGSVDVERPQAWAWPARALQRRAPPVAGDGAVW